MLLAVTCRSSSRGIRRDRQPGMPRGAHRRHGPPRNDRRAAFRAQRVPPTLAGGGGVAGLSVQGRRSHSGPRGDLGVGVAGVDVQGHRSLRRPRVRRARDWSPICGLSTGRDGQRVIGSARDATATTLSGGSSARGVVSPATPSSSLGTGVARSAGISIIRPATTPGEHHRCRRGHVKMQRRRRRRRAGG